MAESIVDQIYDAIKAELEDIEEDGGTNYWYTPSKVFRDDFPTKTGFFRDGFGDYVYMIVDSGAVRQVDSPAAYGEVAKRLDVPIYLTAKDKRGETDPYLTDTPAGKVRTRMAKDVVNKLEGNYTRNGLAFDTEVAEETGDFEGVPTGWIMERVHLIVTFSADIGEP